MVFLSILGCINRFCKWVVFQRANPEKPTTDCDGDGKPLLSSHCHSLSSSLVCHTCHYLVVVVVGGGGGSGGGGCRRRRRLHRFDVDSKFDKIDVYFFPLMKTSWVETCTYAAVVHFIILRCPHLCVCIRACALLRANACVPVCTCFPVCL